MRARAWLSAVLALALLAGGCEKKRGYSTDSALCWAAHEGDLARVQSALLGGASVHVTDYQGRTLLHNAAQGGNLEVARFLVRYGAHIDPMDDAGRTPVMLALAENHRALVEYLVDRGAALDIHLAAYLGDTAEVRDFLDSGVRVDTKGLYGWTPLNYAVCGNQPEVAKMLIEAGADLNAIRNTKHLSSGFLSGAPLHLAVSAGYADVAELLIDAGADTEVLDPYGLTPLCSAIRRGQTEMVRLLLANGASPDGRCRDNDFCGGIPLGVAIEDGYFEIVEMLLAGGAEVNAKDDFGWMPLHVAVTSYYRGAVDANLTLARPHTRAAQEEWDRYGAASNEIREAFIVRMVDLLIAHGADVNGKDEEGLTPLHCAAYHGHRGAVELFLVKGADVNAGTVSDPGPRYGFLERDLGFRIAAGVTPLHEAVVGGDPDVVGLLLGHGAEVNAAEASGNRPLHYAVVRAGREIVGQLLAAGADVNTRNDHGATPLVMALRNGRIETARALIDAGAAKVVMRDHSVRIPVEYREEGALLLHRALGGGPEIWRMRSGEDGNPVVVLDQEGRSNEWVRLLLENGADPNERDEKGDTPLHAAILLGEVESARLLIAHDADAAAGNHANLTPLHHAASQGQRELVSILLAQRADVNAQDNDGDTPLHGAARRGHKEAVKLLLAHGADPKVENSRGRTPVDEARRRGHGEIVQLLTAGQGADR